MTAVSDSPTSTAATAGPPAHPLEPLSAAEIAAAGSLLRELAGLAPTARFVFITLLPWMVVAMFVAGVVIAIVMRTRAPARYADLGHFTLAEIDTAELDAVEVHPAKHAAR